MTISNNFSAFTFIDSLLNGSITDASGHVIYILTTEKRNLGSDATTITRPEAGIVAIIRWGSVINLKRRSVVLPNGTVPAKEYMAEGKVSSLGGPGSQVFQDQGGNEYYWSNQECYEGQNQDLVAYYEPADANRPLGPRLWVHAEYLSPNVLNHIITTSLLMAKTRKKASPGPARRHGKTRKEASQVGPARVSPDAPSSRISSGAASSQRHGKTRKKASRGPARISSNAPSSRISSGAASSQRHGPADGYGAVGGYVGVYNLAGLGGVPNNAGAYGGSYNYGGGCGSGVVNAGGGGGGGGDCGGAFGEEVEEEVSVASEDRFVTD
ncbi:hypothetical protein M407DRAFT_33562 [Tulasnella calospora MUT 4182]|uniref:DUF6593 domain-containing protein n=1 Tax=Tulasnella calospora MUT 4182 TaxID=1051891 RepID=A0A0C3L571_9AGAM|nr:hypothetical protein M407DRAFT_33562 [Tulasnella calospora MUT 4182]